MCGGGRRSSRRGIDTEEWSILKKQIKERTKRKEVLDKKFSNGMWMTEEFKHLWKEAEWIINDIKRDKEKVESKIKSAKKKKMISSLELKVRGKEEEIELVEKFRKELEELEEAMVKV